MRALPVLEPRRASLETCVFCPKLCRTACPVSNAEPRETLTPWGKMSLAWMSAHGDVPVDASHAAPAWACTGCFGCRELCDHRNPVADVLIDARAALAPRGVAPEGARRVIARFAGHDAQTRERARALATTAPRAVEAGDRGVSRAGGAAARTALLVGCGYLRRAPAEARHAVDATAALTNAPVMLVEGCCGLPLRLAGDVDGFRAHARSFARSLANAGVARLLVVDPGCALALRRRYPEAGVDVPGEMAVEVLVEVAARWLGEGSRSGSRSGSGSQSESEREGAVRWHDPCQLGRGLGVFDAPRAVIAHVLGRPPDEFPASRHEAICSGAGGLLPSTMPDVAQSIARARADEAARADAERGQPRGGRIVTGCASSLVALRKAAGHAAVDDIVSWIARAVVT
jgi:Fe-S oxidoreductase